MSHTNDKTTTVAWIALGTNLGHKGQKLLRLRGELATGNVQISAASDELITRAVGITQQPDFLNQVVRLVSVSPLTPQQWLEHCKDAERRSGRLPTYTWGPRHADADVLLLGARGEIVVDMDMPELHVPHLEMANRPFGCAMLAQLEPTLVHPTEGWLIRERAGHFPIQQAQ